jgi:hypothetical protein
MPFFKGCHCGSGTNGSGLSGNPLDFFFPAFYLRMCRYDKIVAHLILDSRRAE